MLARRVWPHAEVRISLLLVFTLLLAGCGAGLTEDVFAIVLNSKGAVNLQPLGTRAHHAKSNAALLRTGDSIRTGDDGRVRLALLPNILIQLRAESQLEIVRLRLTKDGDETDEGMVRRYAHVKLMSGRFDALQEWRGQAPTELVVSTPHGNLVAKDGCLYSVAVEEAQTRITCARGTVAFHPSAGSAAFAVPSGSVGTWWPELGENVAPAVDERGRAELTQAAGADNDLRVARQKIKNLLP